MRRVRRVAAVVALVGAVSGCSVYEDLTTSDFAKQDADAIATAAGEAMQDVTSMRLTGQVRDKGIQAFVDITMDQDETCTGTMRLGGSNIDIRRVGDKAWLKGDDGAFNRLSDIPLTDAQLEELSSKWIVVEDTSILRLCDIDAYLKTFALVEYASEPSDEKGEDDRAGHEDDLSGEVQMTVGEETDLAGQTVVSISGSPGGAHDETAWVLSEAPHYVVKIESTSAQDGSSVALSEFDVDVEVEQPAKKDVFRP